MAEDPRLPFSEVSVDWTNEIVYVIGGGPSLEGFDFDRVRNQGLLLGCNKSAFRANCDAMVSIDQHFVRMHRSDIVDFVSSGRSAYLALPVNDREHKPVHGATYLKRTRHDGLSENRGELYGVHTGYAALNLAVLKGCKEVALLGLDMAYSKEGKPHWHESYSWQNKQSAKFYDQWSRNFVRAAKQCEALGVSVTVFGPSKITEFPRRPLSDLY